MDYSLNMFQLPGKQSGFDLRKTAHKSIVALQHEIHVLDVLVVLVLLKCDIQCRLRDLMNTPMKYGGDCNSRLSRCPSIRKRTAESALKMPSARTSEYQSDKGHPYQV